MEGLADPPPGSTLLPSSSTWDPLILTPLRYLIGFSCGANLCIHYLATSGSECPFIAAGSVSNGYDIWHGSGLLRDNDRINDGIAAQFLKSVLEQVCGR